MLVATVLPMLLFSSWHCCCFAMKRPGLKLDKSWNLTVASRHSNWEFCCVVPLCLGFLPSSCTSLSTYCYFSRSGAIKASYFCPLICCMNARCLAANSLNIFFHNVCFFCDISLRTDQQASRLTGFLCRMDWKEYWVCCDMWQQLLVSCLILALLKGVYHALTENDEAPHDLQL